mgnify:CR=1 FL=1
MELWQKILSVLLILAIPMSTWASVDITSGCPHGSDDMQQMVEVARDHGCHNASEQNEHAIPSNTTTNSPCQCSSHLDCFSSVLNVIGITTDNKLIIPNNTSSLLGYRATLRLPITITSLFRPPNSIY